MPGQLAQGVEAGQHVSTQLHVLALKEVKGTCAPDHPTRTCHITTSTSGVASTSRWFLQMIRAVGLPLNKLSPSYSFTRHSI